MDGDTLSLLGILVGLLFLAPTVIDAIQEYVRKSEE